jgi:5'-deoxynucleotidase YfbR-like HD superfamily hydrolase
MSLAGMITWSGVEVTRDAGVPHLQDIAVALSRMPRFSGMTVEPWSVLQHSLFVMRMAERDRLSPEARIAALLHDAHESLTSDISTHFKTLGMKALQAQLDERIMAAYMPGGLQAYTALGEFVKALDKRALLAEAVVKHPAVTRENVVHYFGEAPFERDVELLEDLSATRLLSENDPQMFLAKYKELKDM